MGINQIIGLVITIAAYGVIWGLVIKSKKIVDRISEKKLNKLREIEEELNL